MLVAHIQCGATPAQSSAVSPCLGQFCWGNSPPLKRRWKHNADGIHMNHNKGCSVNNKALNIDFFYFVLLRYLSVCLYAFASHLLQCCVYFVWLVYYITFSYPHKCSFIPLNVLHVMYWMFKTVTSLLYEEYFE